MRSSVNPNASEVTGLRAPGHLYLVPERAIPLAEYVPSGRALHLIDLENLMGGPRMGTAAARLACEAYRGAYPVAPGDQVIVAANPALGLGALLAWPGARVRLGGGPNGADRELVAAVSDTRWTAERFQRIVIGSGDGIFTQVVGAYKSLGVPVGVVSRESALSWTLATAASFVKVLPDVASLEVVA